MIFTHTCWYVDGRIDSSPRVNGYETVYRYEAADVV